MDDILIFDDLISKEHQDEIESLHVSPNFGWYLSATPNHYTIDPNLEGALKDHNIPVQDQVQLVHTFLKDGGICSSYFNSIDNLFREFVLKTGMKIDGFYRVKSNLQLKSNFSNKKFCNIPHIDSYRDHVVAIYYVNDSDGDTRIFHRENGEYKILKQISPKKGRFVVFNGKHYHAGAHPSEHDKRIVINFNFI